MFNRAKRLVAVAAVGAVLGGGVPMLSDAAFASAATSVASEAKASRGPIIVKNFWSAILRVFITVSRHADGRMKQYGMSMPLLKTILNEGKVTGRGGGVTKVKYGQWEARVNTSSGNVITVIRNTSGGSSGGR